MFGWPKRRVVWYLLGFVVMFLSFSINIFGVGPNNWFSHFQKDSEVIVTKTVDCQTGHNGVGYNGPVMPQQGQAYSVMTEPGCDGKKYDPYTPQYGIQARLIAFFAPDNKDGALQHYFLAVKALLVTCMVLVLLAFVYFAQREFGGVVGPVVFFLLCISDWIVGFARNMYWVPFLMFLPFVFSFGFYQHFKAKNKLLWFYAILGVMFFVKFLNGYEYTTTLALSAFAPILYFEFKNVKTRLFDLWQPAVRTVAVSIIAFCLAFLCNITALQHYYGSWSKAITKVQDRAEERSDLSKMQANVIVGFEATLPKLYATIDQFYSLEAMKKGDQNPVKYMMLSGVNYILSPAVSLPVVIREPLSIFVSSIAAIGVLAYVLLRNIKKIYPKVMVNTRALMAWYWLGIAAAFSWLLAMPGHAYPHAHVNPIIFYIPFLMVCYVIIGIAIGRYYPKNARKRARG